jgi:hypothetical protein
MQLLMPRCARMAANDGYSSHGNWNHPLAYARNSQKEIGRKNIPVRQIVLSEAQKAEQERKAWNAEIDRRKAAKKGDLK